MIGASWVAENAFRACSESAGPLAAIWMGGRNGRSSALMGEPVHYLAHSPGRISARQTTRIPRIRIGRGRRALANPAYRSKWPLSHGNSIRWLAPRWVGAGPGWRPMKGFSRTAARSQLPSLRAPRSRQPSAIDRTARRRYGLPDLWESLARGLRRFITAAPSAAAGAVPADKTKLTRHARRGRFYRRSRITTKSASARQEAGFSFLTLATFAPFFVSGAFAVTAEASPHDGELDRGRQLARHVRSDRGRHR